MCLTLPLWGEHQRAGPGEHGYSYEGQTRSTAQAQVKGKMDECCLHGLPEMSSKWDPRTKERTMSPKAEITLLLF